MYNFHLSTFNNLNYVLRIINVQLHSLYTNLKFFLHKIMQPLMNVIYECNIFHLLLEI